MEGWLKISKFSAIDPLDFSRFVENRRAALEFAEISRFIIPIIFAGWSVWSSKMFVLQAVKTFGKHQRFFINDNTKSQYCPNAQTKGGHYISVMGNTHICFHFHSLT